MPTCFRSGPGSAVTSIKTASSSSISQTASTRSFNMRYANTFQTTRTRISMMSPASRRPCRAKIAVPDRTKATERTDQTARTRKNAAATIAIEAQSQVVRLPVTSHKTREAIAAEIANRPLIKRIVPLKSIHSHAAAARRTRLRHRTRNVVFASGGTTQRSATISRACQRTLATS